MGELYRKRLFKYELAGEERSTLRHEIKIL